MSLVLTSYNMLLSLRVIIIIRTSYSPQDHYHHDGYGGAAREAARSTLRAQSSSVLLPTLTQLLGGFVAFFSSP